MLKIQANYVFIDGNNLYLGAREQGWRLDYKRLRIFLINKYSATKIFLFIGYLPKNQTLYSVLKKLGYICVFKPTLSINTNSGIKVKGNVDAELVLQVMIEYFNFNKAIIISGDGDFQCLIKYLAENGKLAKIIVPNKHYSSLLRKYSYFIVKLDNFKNKVIKQKRGISAEL